MWSFQFYILASAVIHAQERNSNFFFVWVEMLYFGGLYERRSGRKHVYSTKHAPPSDRSSLTIEYISVLAATPLELNNTSEPTSLLCFDELTTFHKGINLTLVIS